MLKITFIIEDPGEGYDELMDQLMQLGAEDIDHEEHTPAPRASQGTPKPKPSAS